MLFLQLTLVAQTAEQSGTCKVYATKGNEYANNDNFVAAEKSYSEAITCDNKYVSVYIDRGIIRCNFLNDSIGGLADFNKALELNPNEFSVYYYRGMYRRKMKQYTSALNDYNKAIEGNKTFSNAYYERGLLYMNNFKKYEDAVSDFSTCLRLDPAATDVYEQRANAYNALGKYAEALSDCNQVVLLKPKDADSYFVRGEIYKALKQYGAACSDYSTAIKLNPTNPDYYYNRGLMYYFRTKSDSATIDFSKAIELSPNNADYWVYRGASYSYMENYSAAETNYTKAISLSPATAKYYYQRGLFYQKQEKYELSLADFIKAEKLLVGEGTAKFYANKAETEYNLKKYSEAIIDYTKVIDQDNTYPNIYYNRGKALYFASKYEDALADFANVKASNSSELYKLNCWKGRCTAKLGRYREALIYYDAAMNYAQDIEIYEERAVIKESLNDKLGAQKDRDSAKQLEIKKVLEKPGVLKKPLTKRDSMLLVNLSRECFQVMLQLTLNLDSYDLLSVTQKETEEPATLEKAVALVNQYRADPNNYELCFEAARMYKKINKRKEATHYFNICLDLLHTRLDKTPSDMETYLSLAMVYTQMDDYYKALDSFEKYYQQYPQSDTLKGLQAMCFIATNNTTKMYEYGINTIIKYPESALSYICINMAVLRDSLSKLGFPVINAANKKLEEIIYYSSLDAACKKYPNNFELKLLYEMFQQLTLVIKVTSEEFKPTLYDKQQVAQMKLFFETALKRNDFPNQSTFYKSLANLYLIDGDYKKSIPYFQKAIELKLNATNNSLSNAGGLYDQLTSAYILMGDTLGAQKVQQDRIAKQPEVDLKAKDYSDMARYYFYYKKYDLAKEYCNKALAIDTLCADAYSGLAAVALIKGNNDAAYIFCVTAVKINTDNEDLFTQSAIIWMLKKEYASAYYCLNVALLINPEAKLAKSIMDLYYEK